MNIFSFDFAIVVGSYDWLTLGYYAIMSNSESIMNKHEL